LGLGGGRYRPAGRGPGCDRGGQEPGGEESQEDRAGEDEAELGQHFEAGQGQDGEAGSRGGGGAQLAELATDALFPGVMAIAAAPPATWGTPG
jgi:hypothetical protein